MVSLSPDLNTIGIQLAMGLTISGCGLLVGEPIAGATLQIRVDGLDCSHGAVYYSPSQDSFLLLRVPQVPAPDGVRELR